MGRGRKRKVRDGERKWKEGGAREKYEARARKVAIRGRPCIERL